MIKEYVLKPTPYTVDADPEVIARLTQFVDYCLSVDGEMTKALEAEVLGKHAKEGPDDEL